MAINEMTEYFAFAESVEPLSGSLFKDGLPEDHELKGLEEARAELGLQRPTHVVWLDCIEARYFLDLDWTTRRLNDSDPVARRERRQNIRELDDERLIVMQILFCGYDDREDKPLALLGNFQWHHIVRTPYGQLPASTGDNYSLMEEGGAIQRFDYHGPASEDLLGRLYNVFNVDFIDEMQGTDFRAPPTGGGQPLTPGGDGGAPEEYVAEDEEEIEAEEVDSGRQIYVTRME